MPALGHYRIWSEQRVPWPEYEVVGEHAYATAIERLLPPLSGGSQELHRDFELVPEPHNKHDPWAVAVQADGATLGYLARDDARAWSEPLRRIVDAGYTPVTNGRLWAYEGNNWEDTDRHGNPTREVRAWLRIGLGDPETALPYNQPPTASYTFLPRSAIVQVTKEDQHTEALLKFVPASGYGMLFATLHEHDVSTARAAKSVVEVRIDDERVGVLTPQMSQRFLPLIRHLETRGLLTACWADIRGSAVAAEVRIDGVKANEAGPEVLDGEPVTLPPIGEATVGLAQPVEDSTPTDEAGTEHVAAAPVSVSGVETAVKNEPDVGLEVHKRANQVPPPLPPAGWYDDPGHPAYIRYWDGQTWTHHVAARHG